MEIRGEEVHFNKQECADTGLPTPIILDKNLAFTLTEKIENAEYIKDEMRVDGHILSLSQWMVSLEIKDKILRLKQLRESLCEAINNAAIDKEVESFRERIPNAIDLD